MFLLGKNDNEMRMCVEALSGLEYEYARDETGKRVKSSTAYRCVNKGKYVCIECGGPDVECVRRIDHHNPGDPGYDGGPEKFFESSSIGQLIEMLTGMGHKFDDEYMYRARLVAAADHCLMAAYKGLCPGVDPGELKEFRMRMRLESSGGKRNRQMIMFSRTETRTEIYAAPTILIGDEEVKDMRDKNYPEIQEVSAQLGTPILCAFSDRRRGEMKTALSNAKKETIKFWLKENPLNLDSVYGMPERGLAGGYKDL